MSEEALEVLAGHDPAAELEKTRGLLSINPEIPEVAPVADPVAGDVIEGFELRGKEKVAVTFDESIYQTNPDGSPKLGSKKQFLLRKEAKKSAKQVISDAAEKVKNAFSSGNKQFSKENADGQEIPLSDHELHEKQAQEAERNAEISARDDELTASAESSAELFFFGGSMLLGLSFANQRDTYWGRVVGHFRRYEEKTGRKVDLPPSMALTMGLGQVAFAISQKEPECKDRLDAGVSVLRDNVTMFLGDKVPFLAPRSRDNQEAKKDD